MAAPRYTIYFMYDFCSLKDAGHGFRIYIRSWWRKWQDCQLPKLGLGTLNESLASDVYLQGCVQNPTGNPDYRERLT